MDWNGADLDILSTFRQAHTRGFPHTIQNPKEKAHTSGKPKSKKRLNEHFDGWITITMSTMNELVFVFNEMKKTVETSIVFFQQNGCTYKKNVEVDVYGWDDEMMLCHHMNFMR